MNDLIDNNSNARSASSLLPIYKERASSKTPPHLQPKDWPPKANDAMLTRAQRKLTGRTKTWWLNGRGGVNRVSTDFWVKTEDLQTK